MGLIQDMAMKQGERAGKKLPQPTTAGDDQVIAAKTGEYVLPPEVVQAIGLDKLNALVQSITGQQPGGQPAEMPQMDGQAMMGEPMMGHARGGLISQFSGVQLNADPLQDDRQSLRKYGFQGGMGADSVATEVSRAAQGMPAADEVMQLGMDKMAAKTPAATSKRRSLNDILDMERRGALGEESNILGYNNGGLIARMQGYAEGGIIEDLYGETQAKRAALRGYTPQPGAIPAQPPSRVPELRNFTPEAGRVPPGATGPRISGIAAQAPSATPSRTIAELDARAAGKTPKPTMQAAGAPQATSPATPQPAARPGMVSRVAQTLTPSRATVAGGLAGAGMAGAGQSFADMGSGYRDAFAQSVGAESPLGTLAADTARTLANVGDAATFGLAGRVGRGIASAVGGGSFGEGFAGESDRDRFLASKQPQQVAQAPQAASEPPAAAPPQQAVAAPAPAAEPKRGPIAGLAARAKPAPQSPVQPAAPQIDPAVMADAQAAQAELDQSPIARVVGGTGGAMTIQYKDGTTKQVGREGLDEVNGFYALTNRASQQYAAQPVEIIAGNAGRAQALPEYGYQQFPDAIARSGKAGDYISGLAQGALDRADPVAAELRTRLAEINAQGDNSIRVSNATDRDGAGRGLRNQLAQIELQQKQQIAQLEKQALEGNQEAVQRIQQLQQLRSRGDNDGRAKLVTDLVKSYSSGTMQPVGADNKPLTLEQYVNQGLELATGTVKSSSTAPSGMKQVGTSGGKPVYQDAQGNRFIGD